MRPDYDWGATTVIRVLHEKERNFIVNGYSIMTDANNLFEGYMNSTKNSGWKSSTRVFGFNLLSNLDALKNELMSKTYVTSHGVEFIQNERGRERMIVGNDIRDRVVRHVLCDKIINPIIKKYLIFDNGASLKGKGISFTRERFEKHLHDYVRKHGSNEGYILFGDFSKYYDNILHAKLLEMYKKLLDEYSNWLIEVCLEDSKIDVSYMSEEEFIEALSKKFNSIEYNLNIPKSLRTGEKLLPKSMNIGDQLSQSSGIFYPTRIDNYVKIVRSIKYYGRYMDDFYIICDSKEELLDVLNGIREIASDLGMFINENKTHIVKLSSNFRFLQIKYIVTPTGHITKCISPKSISRERRKLKKYKNKLLKRTMLYSDIENAYKSWMGAYSKIMSKDQIHNMKELYKQLFGKEPKWKK